MRLCLFQCDHVDAELMHVAGDYGDMFERLFERVAAPFEVFRHDVIDGVWPERIEDYDAFWISGSRFSVYERIPWIEELAERVRQIARLERPLVGICFGHQMLAHALGGRVERSTRGWGLGIKRAVVRERRDWMEPALEGPRLIMSHQDQVIELPPEGVVLTSNDHCPVSAMKIGATNLGYQGHPEFSPEYLDALMSSRLDRIPIQLIREARDTLKEPHDGEIVGRWLVRFITRAIRERSSESSLAD